MVLFAFGYSAWLAAGFAVPSLAVAIGGLSLIPGAIVAGSFAWQVYRGRTFAAVDRRTRWIIVLACVLYWLSAFTTPIDGFDLTHSSFGVLMFAAGISLYPFVSAGLLSLSQARHGRMGIFLFDLDLAIVGWATAMVLWHLVLHPLAVQAGTSTIDLVLLATRPPTTSP